MSDNDPLGASNDPAVLPAECEEMMAVLTREQLIQNRVRCSADDDAAANALLDKLVMPHSFALAEMLWTTGFCFPQDSIETAVSLWNSTEGLLHDYQLGEG